MAHSYSQFVIVVVLVAFTVLIDFFKNNLSWFDYFVYLRPAFAHLDEMDLMLLRSIVEKFGGGPVGISNLSAVIGEEEETLEEVVEPYLIKEGFIKRTPRGRIVMPRAYKHLGLQLPSGIKEGQTNFL